MPAVVILASMSKNYDDAKQLAANIVDLEQRLQHTRNEGRGDFDKGDQLAQQHRQAIIAELQRQLSEARAQRMNLLAKLPPNFGLPFNVFQAKGR